MHTRKHPNPLQTTLPLDQKQGKGIKAKNEGYCCGREERMKTSVSRSKSCKRIKKEPLGLMERTVYENLEYYKSLNNSKAREREEEAMVYATLFPGEAELKLKPDLNQKTKKLYEKIKRERRLSPNVFVRLHADEESRSRSKIISIIKRIKQVTPTKKVTRQDLQKFSTPKEMKFFTKYLNLPPTE